MRGLTAVVVLLLGGCAVPRPALLRTCWPEGQARYGCPAGEVLRWQAAALPLTYVLEPDALCSEEEIAAVHRAADRWNRVLGRRVFVPVLPWYTGRVRVVVSWGGIGAGAAATRHWGDEGPEVAQVSLRQTGGDPGVTERLALHELGHVLGLAHDGGGVMAEVLALTGRESVSAAEVALLRGVYAP